MVTSNPSGAVTTGKLASSGADSFAQDESMMITRIMQGAIIDRENIFLIMDLLQLGGLE